MSMSTIVIAAIALLVLIVLLMIFGGRMGIFKRTLDNQTNSNENKCPAGSIKNVVQDCPSGERSGSFSNVYAGFKCCN